MEDESDNVMVRLVVGGLVVVGGVLTGLTAWWSNRKGHKKGFDEASGIYEKKFHESRKQKEQIRKEFFGEEFLWPKDWNSDFLQKKLEVFVRERYESKPLARDQFLDFIQFCIEMTSTSCRNSGRLEDSTEGRSFRSTGIDQCFAIRHSDDD